MRHIGNREQLSQINFSQSICTVRVAE